MFSALLAGNRNPDYIGSNFNNLGNNAFFWGSTEYYSGGANDLYFYGDGSYIYFGYGYKEDGFSVRCVKD